jgi:hypothetical protein
MRALIFFIVSEVLCMAQHTPNLDAQRSAMKKLDFMVGKWIGEARIIRGPDNVVVMTQTEEVQYKLDGLILSIEGVGLTKADGKPVLQAFGIVSYDDEKRTYHMRAFNDGRFLETEVTLPDEGKGMKWGFALGQIHMNSVMRIDQKGDWTELHEIVIGAQAPRKYMEVSVSRRK